jgi:hypothetical protein
MRREVRTSGGFCSAHDPTLHIGIGDAKSITDVEITWPDGTKQEIADVLAGETVVIHQIK